MNASRWLTTLTLAGLMAGTLLSPALAQEARDSRDRGPLGDVFSYIRLASPKAELGARTVRLNDRVRRAERNREISRSEASDLYRRLDRVRDFLRDDRHLERDEFKRRDGDLDRIERDLDRKLDRRDDRYRRDRRDRDSRDRDYRDRDYRDRDR